MQKKHPVKDQFIDDHTVQSKILQRSGITARLDSVFPLGSFQILFFPSEIFIRDLTTEQRFLIRQILFKEGMTPLIPAHDFKRYIRVLKENGINTTTDLATAYITCSLGSCKGLGKKFFGLLKDFLDHHVTYKQIYDELQDKLNQKEDTINANEQMQHQKTE